MADFYVYVARNRGEAQKVHGPFESYVKAHEFALPFAQEGHDVEVRRGDVVCDFCGHSEVSWRYPAEDFSIAGTSFGSRGHWAACEICHDYIENDDRDKMVTRSIAQFKGFNPNANVDDSFLSLSCQFDSCTTSFFWLAKEILPLRLDRQKIMC